VNCTRETITKTACAGHLDTVIWLWENRTVGYDSLAIGRASIAGHLPVVKWLVGNLTGGIDECDKENFEYFCDETAKLGHLDIVEYLLECQVGCFTDRGLYLACRRGHFEIAKKLFYTYDPSNTDSYHVSLNPVDGAISGGHLEIAMWLDDHGCVCGPNALDNAYQYHFENDDILEFVHGKMERDRARVQIN